MDTKDTASSFDSTITARHLKAHLSEALSRAQFGGEPVVVTKNGKPAVAIVSIELFLRLRALEDASDVAAAEAARAEAKSQGTVSLDEMRASIGL